MQFAFANVGSETFVRVVESSNPQDMQRRLTQVLAELAATTVTIGNDTFRVMIVSIDLAGGGDGHTFVARVVASAATSGGPIGPIDPALVSVSCFMASQADALVRAEVAAIAALPAASQYLAREQAGASGGTRFMSVVVVANDQNALNAVQVPPGIISFAEDAVGDAVAVPIAVQGTPVVVPGPFVVTSGGWSLPTPGSGIIQWDNDQLFTALARARLSVRATVAGPVVVRVAAAVPGVPPVFALQQQTITVDNVLFHHVTAESFVAINPNLGANQIALAVANDTSTDDLEVLAAELTIQRI